MIHKLLNSAEKGTETAMAINRSDGCIRGYKVKVALRTFDYNSVKFMLGIMEKKF